MSQQAATIFACSLTFGLTVDRKFVIETTAPTIWSCLLHSVHLTHSYHSDATLPKTTLSEQLSAGKFQRRQFAYVTNGALLTGLLIVPHIAKRLVVNL